MTCIHFTKRSIIVIVLILAVLIRVLFFLYHPKPQRYNDSLGYYQIGLQIVEQPSLKNIISEFRTPLYPLFLIFGTQLSLINNKHIPNSIDELQQTNGNSIMFIQHIVGIMGMIISLYLLINMGFSNAIILLLSLCIVGNLNVFYWERSLMTEALAPTMLLIYFALFYHVLLLPKKINFIFLYMSFIFIFLLKPAFILLPFLTFPILYISLKKSKEKMYVIFSLLLCGLTLAGYSVGNKIYHNYFGIQRYADINTLSKILDYNTPIDAGRKYTYFYEKIMDYRAMKGVAEPQGYSYIYDIDTWDTKKYTNNDFIRMNELQSFTNTVMLHNLFSYTINTLSAIPAAVTEDVLVIKEYNQRYANSLPTGGGLYLNIFFSALFTLYHFFQFFSLLIFPLYLMMLNFFSKKRTTKIILLTAIGSFVVFQVYLTVFNTWDSNRVLISIQPLLFIFFIGSLEELLPSVIKLLKNRLHPNQQKI